MLVPEIFDELDLDRRSQLFPAQAVVLSQDLFFYGRTLFGVGIRQKEPFHFLIQPLKDLIGTVRAAQFFLRFKKNVP